MLYYIDRNAKTNGVPMKPQTSKNCIKCGFVRKCVPSKRRLIIVDLAEKTVKELKHEDENISGEVSIGCGEKNMKPLSEMIASFQQKYPDVNFNIYTAIADDVKERLENGILDMGLLLEPVEISRYHYIRMPLKEKWQVLMRRNSLLTGKQSVTPQDA